MLHLVCRQLPVVADPTVLAVTGVPPEQSVEYRHEGNRQKDRVHLCIAWGEKACDGVSEAVDDDAQNIAPPEIIRGSALGAR